MRVVNEGKCYKEEYINIVTIEQKNNKLFLGTLTR